jgi:hypothetical protein
VTATRNSRPQHTPDSWWPGITRVRHLNGNTGTFVADSEDVPGNATARGRHGALVRFDNETSPVNVVDPADLAVITADPFTGIAPHVPTRYAPGHSAEHYPYPKAGPYDVDYWYPVIYYPGDHPGSTVRRVEPWPAARADNTDELPELADNGIGVTVVCRDAIPTPTSADLTADWTITARPLVSDVAYDVFVLGQRQLMAAWCEAHAISCALNNRTCDRLGVALDDIEVLLAAERGALVGDSRMAGKKGELRWKPLNTVGRVDERWVTGAQTRRLRDHRIPFIRPVGTRQCQPARAGSFSSAGAPWTETLYGLTPDGEKALAAIRAQYDGPVRCRVCGCTATRGCPTADPHGDRRSWVEADLCSACRDERR